MATLTKQEKKELDEFYVLIEKESVSELHARSVDFAKKFMDQYPNTWDHMLKHNRFYKAITKTIKKKRNGK